MSDLLERLPSPDLTDGMRSGFRLAVRFGLIGLAGFVVDVGVYNLARHVVGTGPLTSKTISVVLATAFSFLGNRSWTFEDRGSRPVLSASVLFCAFNGVALLISLLCLAVSSYGLGLTSPLAENISTNGVGLALGTAFRFWAYGRWVFPHPEPSADGSASSTGTGPPR